MAEHLFDAIDDQKDDEFKAIISSCDLFTVNAFGCWGYTPLISGTVCCNIRNILIDFILSKKLQTLVVLITQLNYLKKELKLICTFQMGPQH